MFSREICEIFKSNFFTEHFRDLRALVKTKLTNLVALRYMILSGVPRPLSIRAVLPTIANQLTGFYMMGTLTVKRLNQ